MAERLQQTFTPMRFAFDRFQKTCRFFHFSKSEKENVECDRLLEFAKILGEMFAEN